MPKRKTSNQNSTNERKIQKSSALNKKVNDNFNIPKLPVEAITKIISYLTDIDDIKNCMLLSKDVNSFMFCTPEIMKKLLFNFDCLDESDRIEAKDFLSRKGKHFKNLRISFNEGSEAYELLPFLNETPNLVEFSFKDEIFRKKLVYSKRYLRSVLWNMQSRRLRDSPSTVDEAMQQFEEYWTKDLAVNHPELKVLEIELWYFEDFLKVTHQINTLEKLTVYIDSGTNQTIMTQFILKQDNLKELNLIVSEKFYEIEFPARNVAEEVKFKLKKLKMITNGNKFLGDYFEDFLESQADNLEEIDINVSFKDSTLDIIFNKCQKLKKFIQETDENSMMIRDSNVMDRTLDTVTAYGDRNKEGTNLDIILDFFPNLNSFDCFNLKESDGNYFMIHDLSINELQIFNLKNAEFSNLKNFTIGRIFDVKSENYWQEFIKNIENVKNLTIFGVENAENILIILKSLKFFTKLQKFSFRYNPGKFKKFIMDNNETIPPGNKFYKILIDLDEKTVKVSTYIVRKCKEMLGILIHYFGDFEFFEFCFNVIAVEKIDIKDHKIDVKDLFPQRKNLMGFDKSLRSLPSKDYKNLRKQ